MLQFHRSVPLVRRTTSSVQFGVDDPVLIDGLTEDDLGLIDLLCRGCDSADYLDAADRARLSRTRALSLLDLLTEAGVLTPPEAASGGSVVRDFAESYAALHGVGPVAAASAIRSRSVIVFGHDPGIVSEALAEAGFDTLVVESADQAIEAGAEHRMTVLISRLTANIGDSSRLFAEDADHLIVRVGDQRADLVPIRPGLTPCATCTVLHSRDEDDGWFAGWRQLAARSRHALIDPLLLRAAATETARMLRAATVGLAEFGPVVRIDARTGRRTQEAAAFHPDCDCRIPLSPNGAPGPVREARVRTARA